ncbi:MAG TPA: flagellar basal body P-ring formation chaperone FlgA [Hyphomicrobiaceae bacterium]
MRRVTAPCLLLFVLLATAGAPASAQEMAVVSTRVIYPGQTIQADALKDIVLKRPPRGISAIVRSSDEIVGKVARRTLLPGRLIPEGSVREPYLVETGSPVTVIFRSGALSISLIAVPLESGAAGDVVKLRNMDSGAVFSGVVLSDGTVRVGTT